MRGASFVILGQDADAPLLQGGWLALLWSFPVVFVLAAIMGLASLMACLGLAHVAEKA